MIKSLSPYYVTTSWTNPVDSIVCSSYTMLIYIWNGNKTSPPTTTYQFTKKNVAGETGNDKVDIARLVSDYIDFTPKDITTTSLVDGSNQMWVKHSVYYNDVVTPQQEATDIMSLAYSWGDEGENVTTIANNILIRPLEYLTSRQSMFIVPLLSPNKTEVVTILSEPNGEINTSFNIGETLASSEVVQYLFIRVADAPTDEYIEVTFNATTITLYPVEDCRYQPLDIYFQNKEGAEQIYTFFKERTQSFTTEDEEYQSSQGQAINGKHQFVRYNVNGRESLDVNTGFIDEEMNIVLTELLLSEKIWYKENNNLIPLNIESKSMTYKTRQKDRLVDYDIKFKKSYNLVNNS